MFLSRGGIGTAALEDGRKALSVEESKVRRLPNVINLRLASVSMFWIYVEDVEVLIRLKSIGTGDIGGIKDRKLELDGRVEINITYVVKRAELPFVLVVRVGRVVLVREGRIVQQAFIHVADDGALKSSWGFHVDDVRVMMSLNDPCSPHICDPGRPRKRRDASMKDGCHRTVNDDVVDEASLGINREPVPKFERIPQQKHSIELRRGRDPARQLLINIAVGLKTDSRPYTARCH